jgi:hypothetical protein
MKTTFITKFLIPFLIVSIPVISQAQITTRKVTFSSGKSSTVIASSLKGRQTIDYTVVVKSGQKLTVGLKTNNNANYYNVLPPGSTGEAIFIGETAGNNYEGTLTKAGTYKIRVFLMRSAARRNEVAKFTLNVGLIN